MDEQRVTRIEIRHTRTSPVYTERETADVSHMNIGSIRHLRSLGLIEGEETGGELSLQRGRGHSTAANTEVATRSGHQSGRCRSDSSFA